MPAVVGAMLALGALCACGATSPRWDAGRAKTLVPMPIPHDLQGDVERAQRLGSTLFSIQTAANYGAEFLADRGRSADGIGAWLVVPKEDSATLYFADRGPRPRIVYQIGMAPGRTPNIANETPEGQEAERLTRMFVAQDVALRSLPAPLVRYDRIAIDGGESGEDGILVYVLNEDADPTRIVFGPHYRVLVDWSARSVVRVTRLTSSHETSPPRESATGDAPEPITVDDDAVDSPPEVYFLESLRHGGAQLVVNTARGVWAISGTEVRYSIWAP
jgi:hypothetical protein